ncbi:uncharacterized protein LOC112086234 [Eutrema salsugineum]|uniref:uncharacterized protein LOC112086234 n=1 Tax=Eutrema salsugineum TaxID=72664 RepID=UPI000CECEE39|nr:uncharacterized protein LOC112086234 [Eutrema salsugineum]
MSYHGPLFTWCNRRDAGLISKKLDRVLKNIRWDQAFPVPYSVFEAGGCSDHLQCRVRLEAEQEKGKKPFKFINAVTELAEFLPMMETFCGNTQPIYSSTSSMFRLAKKLKALKPSIRSLAKNILGNLSKKAKEAYEILCEKQSVNALNPSLQNVEEEISAYRRWDSISKLEKKFLKQRSKVHWLQIRDGNNKTFHKAVVSREATNSIREIKRRDGMVVTSADEIKAEAAGFFSKLLDTEASAQRIGYHPKCQNLGLTHLSFADDIMVLSDGKVRSVEGIVKVSNDFVRISGLKISMEKSTIYLAGVTDLVRTELDERFHFQTGHLPVRYLGLPHLTKQMRKQDYLPLLEKCRKRIRSWSVRSLSIAGWLQLIRSVLHSIMNFWMAGF